MKCLINHVLNVQSFIDDPDSLRRKRQKFNNSPNALVLRRVQAEAEKHAAILNQPIQYNFNIIKPEPMERISPYGGQVASGGSFSIYSIGNPPPQPTMQTLRPQVSPGRTPSPIEYSPYNPTLIQSQLSPQYQPTSSQVVQQQQQLSINTHAQQYPYLQNTLQSQEQLLLNRTTSNYPELHTLDNAVGGVKGTDVTSVLDMDSQQYNFDPSFNQLSSMEFDDFGTHLSENLSSGLSISDSTKVDANIGANAEVNNVEETNNMTDSFTRITNNTIQELCTLNNLYKPT